MNYLEVLIIFIDIICTMKKEDRNTAIIIIVVLVVCTVSLVAIGSSLWNIVSPGVNAFFNYIGINVRLATVDYNFQVPAVGSSQSSPTTSSQGGQTPPPSVVPANYSYNFPVPPAPTNGGSSVTGLRDAILTDAQLAGYGTGTDTPTTELLLNIPKIKVTSPVLQGLGGDDLLDRGFWAYPSSKPIGQGELILLCHRRFFGPYDPRTCWNLDKLVKGDEIYLKGSTDVTLTYKIIAVNELNASDPTIYNPSETENYLKIVTCHPLYSDANRLVVLAELQD